MAVSLLHTTQAVGSYANDGELGTAEWNEEHTLTMATNKLLGRSTAGTGAVEELTVGTGLSLSAGTLSSTVTATAPGGSDTQVQYNNAGAFGGASGITTNGTDLTLGSSSSLFWSTDLILRRGGAANLNLGAADSGTPVAQTLSVQGASGTNIAGANLTIAGSRSTGSAAGGSIIVQVAPAGGGGAAQNALVDALTIDSARNVVIPLVDNSSTLRLGGSSSGTTFQVDEDGSMQIRRLNSTSFGLSLGTRGGGAGQVLGVGAFTLVAWASVNQPDGDSTYDVFLARRGAANLTLGEGDAASPVAQTISVQCATGTNVAGVNWTLAASRGTGTGAGGDLIVQVAPAGSSGSSQNTLQQAFRVHNTRTVTAGAAFTVATLPAAGTQGRRAWVTDATAPTFLGALTGGGAVVCPVFDNGTAWVSA